jgi:hypothetical protein
VVLLLLWAGVADATDAPHPEHSAISSRP